MFIYQSFRLRCTPSLQSKGQKNIFLSYRSNIDFKHGTSIAFLLLDLYTILVARRYHRTYNEAQGVFKPMMKIGSEHSACQDSYLFKIFKLIVSHSGKKYLSLYKYDIVKILSLKGKRLTSVCLIFLSSYSISFLNFVVWLFLISSLHFSIVGQITIVGASCSNLIPASLEHILQV